MGKSISGSEFEGKVLKADKPVLVDFFASWCGPCQMMTPVIEEIASEQKDKAYVYKVDIDEEHELANKYNVMSIPTILIFKDGEVVNQFNGVTEKQELTKSLA
jgi:thioredoxin 1